MKTNDGKTSCVLSWDFCEEEELHRTESSDGSLVKRREPATMVNRHVQKARL